MSETTDSNRNKTHKSNGKFAPGNKLGGRPKGSTTINKILREIGAQPWDGDRSMTKLEAVAMQLYEGALEGNRQSIEYLLNRLGGTPVQQTHEVEEAPDAEVIVA